ncbi:MAG: ABC transporter permease [Geminicoccaceae bacterium]|nr:MAG: ABC transporter permease [Geminicoccaceae bacterium]
MSEVFNRLGPVVGAFVLATALLWVAMLVVLPQLVLVDLSFRPNLPPALRGSPGDVYTLLNYQSLFLNDLHRAIFFQTIWSSMLVTVLALIVCYPIAYYLAQVAKGGTAAILVVGLVIPFWVNEILRTFAWFLILSRNGILNQALMGSGLTDAPINFGGVGAVMIGMVYAYILFMVFPLYNAIESLDRNQIEAARDLGAPWWKIHTRVVIPHAKPGIAVGCIMVFMLAAGTVAVPQIMQSLPGGTNARWFTQVIYSWFFDGGDWNRGAAYAFALLVLCVLFIFLMMRVFKVGLRDIAK